MAQTVKNQALRLTIKAAAEALVSKHGGVTAAAKATGLIQQNLSNWKNKGTATLESLLELAAAYGATVEGLIGEFAPAGSELRKLAKSGDVKKRMAGLPGWTLAVERAKEMGGKHLPPWAWAFAGDVSLPVEPAEITPTMALDLARFMANHVEISAVRPSEMRGGKL